jgi:TetR/AcrR family transcriptional repressor of nem operon
MSTVSNGEEVRVASRNSRGRGDTRTLILDVAERLVQSRGFNGFSYAAVAEELDITTPALHYHFAGKAELGEALISRYASRFAEALHAIDANEVESPAKLEAYMNLYLDVLRNKRMCLCGMLAAEYQTLPEAMTATVIQFFDDNEVWLERVLELGQGAGSLHFAGSARDAARMIVGALEGAMLVARPYADITRFEATASRLLTDLTGSTSKTIDSA